MRLAFPLWPRGRLSLQSRILCAVLAAGVMLVGLDGWRTWQNRDAVIAADEGETANLARSLAQQAHDTIRIADMVLCGLRERVETDGLAPAAAARLDRLIAARLPDLPALAGIAAFDAAGNRTAGEGSAADALLDIADRSYFQYHQVHAERGVHVGDPILSRVDGQWSLTVSRRIDAPDGRFAGVVRARISIPFLQHLYRSFDLGREGLISLTSTAGTIIAPSDGDSRNIGVDTSGGPVFRRLGAGQAVGSISYVSPMDGVGRFASFRRLDDYPLFIVVGHSLDRVLAGWRADAWRHVTLSIGLAVILAVAGRRFALQVSVRQQAERRYRLLAENSSDAIVCVGLDGSRHYVSPAFSVLTGWGDKESLSGGWTDIIHADDRPAHAEAVRRLRAGASQVEFCFRYIRKDGSLLWVETRAKLLQEPGEEAQIIANVRDISKRRAAEEKIIQLNRELVEQANTDGLTGLANRRRFDEALAQEWRRALRDELPLSLLMIDVDRFKLYNDRYGHQRGDDCLRTVAAAAARIARRPADLTARYGGEEFVVLLPGVDEAGAASLAARVLAAIRDTGIVHEGNAPAGVVTASVGAACVLPCGGLPECSPEALLAGADAALYEAKRSGRNKVVTQGRNAATGGREASEAGSSPLRHSDDPSGSPELSAAAPGPAKGSFLQAWGLWAPLA